jgi:ribose-phosphate pyrophosphokinase
MDEIKLFAGTTNCELTKDISKHIKVDIGNSVVRRFADGELKIKIEENIRGRDVFIVQSTNPPAENIMELLLFIDAAKRASADRITAIIPYYGYARQDRKDEPRVPISSKMIANLLTVSGANRILTIDLHSEQIQGFFDIPVDQLYAAPVFIEYYQSRSLDNYVIVSPDAGRVKHARGFARRLGKEIPIAIVDKRRTGPNQSVVYNIIGDVAGKTALIYDDILDTGGTMVSAAEAMLGNGAKEVYACAVHALLSRDAPQRIMKSAIKELVVTNTIPLDSSRMVSKVKVLSVAGLLGEAIMRIHDAESISVLFKEVEE